MQRKSKLFPLYFPQAQKYQGCQRIKFASAVQILSDNLENRQRYFCLSCAHVKGIHPTQQLVKRVQAMQRDYKRKPAQQEQQPKQKKARAGGQGK